MLSLVLLAYRVLCAKALYLTCKITAPRTEPLVPPSASHSNLVGLCAEGLLKHCNSRWQQHAVWRGAKMKWKSLSHVWLFATPWTVACQVPLSVDFSRTEYWCGLPFPSPGDLCNPGIKPRTTALKANSLFSQPSTQGISDWSNRTENFGPASAEERKGNKDQQKLKRESYTSKGKGSVESDMNSISQLARYKMRFQLLLRHGGS